MAESETTDEFESERERDFSNLANWIEDSLDVDHSTANEMADAALDVKYEDEKRTETNQ